MKRLTIILLWILLVPAFSSFAADSDVVWLGVVRNDNTILPFAMYDGVRWLNPWESSMTMVDPGNTSDFPDTFEAVPKLWYAPLPEIPREWYFQRATGNAAAVTVTRPVTIYSWCETATGLLMEDAQVPVDTHQAVSLSGFAVTPETPTTGVTPIEEGTDEWTRMLSLIRPAFEREEAAVNHPLSSDNRGKAEFSVSCLVRGAPDGEGRVIAYFDVERDYRGVSELDELSRFSRSYLTGWILMDSSGTPSFIETSFRGKARSDGMIVTRLTPLGIAFIKGQSLWIVRDVHYEAETYQIYKVSPDGVEQVYKSFGGGC